MATARRQALSILVIRRGGLGDTLLLLPLLRALRRAHPDARLTYAGVREFADVLVHVGAADAAVSTESLALWSANRATGPFAAYDLVIGDEPAVADLVLDPLRVAPDMPFGLQLVRQAALATQWPDDAWVTGNRGHRDGPLVLAPGSGGRAKCWPRARWLELAARLAAAAEPLLVVVGPTEREREDPRAWPWPEGTAFLADVTPVQLAERLATARAFVGNDSGPGHLAAMLGIPTVAVFGPTDPRVWAPIGPAVRVATGEHFGAWPDVGAVLDHLQRLAQVGSRTRHPWGGSDAALG